uniref:Uncharacterized protein n=1 Tax=Prymnesium polylepis TaxID=72548 RepID=A0A6T7WDL7_9EUKA|mmetsp:Transcript_10649/g.26475  ORF Transcript_10649/g.26475 Transcript_10649/m.26475 type:complete len:121 (+) Transcript_10649:3-365(+)
MVTFAAVSELRFYHDAVHTACEGAGDDCGCPRAAGRCATWCDTPQACRRHGHFCGQHAQRCDRGALGDRDFFAPTTLRRLVSSATDLLISATRGVISCSSASLSPAQEQFDARNDYKVKL